MLAVIGLNHRSAPIGVRERLAFSGPRLTDVLVQLREKFSASEAVVLSTCNRTEIYVESESSLESQVAGWLQAQAVAEPLDGHLYTRGEEATIRHLFRVASGLDSMVLGEHEILGQVKNAYLAAQKQGNTGKLFNVLFQRSLYVGKRVRTDTALGTGAGSIGSAAVAMAERIFNRLEDRTVMILGAGKMAERTAKHLLGHRVRSLWVSNRTFERAQELARELGGRALPFEEAMREMEHADIVICSTAAPHPVILPETISKLMGLRKGRSLFFIDIAVPRDVHPDVHGIDNVYVYNIDDLQNIIQDNRVKRSGDVLSAEGIVEEKAREFMAWLAAYRAGIDHTFQHGDPGLPRASAQ